MKSNQNSKLFKPPFLLVILDGWGVAEPNEGNAVCLARTPVMDKLTRDFPNTLLCASGSCVGLFADQDGNSEAGHLNIGSGRLVEQDAVVITRAIKDGTFFKNAAFKEALHNVKKHGSNLHLVGMLSNGMSAHSHPEHLYSLLNLAKINKISKVYLHLFTDGRDSPKYVSMKLVDELERHFYGNEMIATIMGRFYGMDRKKDWKRTELAYDALVTGKGRVAESAKDAITEAYNRGENDEFIQPYIITKKGRITPRIDEKDSVIFFNLRSDRARQLAKAFVQRKFLEQNPGSFIRKKLLKNLVFIGMTDFGPDLEDMLVAYPSADMEGTLPMALRGMRQLYIAETEKYAHVTYFFNGGYKGKVAGEDQFMVPSPDVCSYDETPAMSSAELTHTVLNNLKNNLYDFTVLNYAAPDMIGHTGNLKAGIECCEKVDGEVGMLTERYLSAGGTVLITADHGNVEEMLNLETGEIDTEHSMNPVPFIIVNSALKNSDILKNKQGLLRDIAPTILSMLGREIPGEMNGLPLI